MEDEPINVMIILVVIFNKQNIGLFEYFNFSIIELGRLQQTWVTTMKGVMVFVCRLCVPINLSLTSVSHHILIKNKNLEVYKERFFL